MRIGVLRVKPVITVLLLWFAIAGLRWWMICSAAPSCPALWDLIQRLSGDAVLPGLALVAYAFITGSRRALLRVMAAGAIISGVLLLALDTYVQTRFHVTLTFPLLARFYSETAAILVYANQWLLLFPFFLGALWRAHLPLRTVPKAQLKFWGALVCLLSFSCQFISREAGRYSIFSAPAAIGALSRAVTAGKSPHYSRQKVESATLAIQSLRKLELPENLPNIILLNVESLSAVDSWKTSGIGHALDELDALTAQGTLFKNLFANYPDSEGAMTAIWEGLPPLPYPGSTRKIYESFGFRGSIFNELRKAGYVSEVLTGGPRGFLGKDSYLVNLGVDRFRADGDVDRFRSAVQKAPWGATDQQLYAEAVAFVREQLARDQKFFLNLITVSSHFPWWLEGDPGANAGKVFRYVARAIVDFHTALAETGFFEHGVLLIAGDHRRWEPARRVEKSKFQDTTRARIFGAAFGQGVKKNFEDPRYIQQMELLFKLKRLLNPDLAMPQPMIFVDAYSQASPWGARDTAPVTLLFRPAWGNQAAKVQLESNRVRISTPDHSDPAAFSALIDDFRAFSQGQSQQRIGGCEKPAKLRSVVPPRPGLYAYRTALSIRRPLSMWDAEHTALHGTIYGNARTDPAPESTGSAPVLITAVGYVEPETAAPLILRVDVGGLVCAFIDGKPAGTASRSDAFGYGYFEIPLPRRHEGKAAAVELRYTHEKRQPPLQLRYWSDKTGKWAQLPKEWLKAGEIAGF